MSDNFQNDLNKTLADSIREVIIEHPGSDDRTIMLGLLLLCENINKDIRNLRDDMDVYHKMVCEKIVENANNTRLVAKAVDFNMEDVAKYLQKKQEVEAQILDILGRDIWPTTKYVCAKCNGTGQFRTWSGGTKTCGHCHE